MKSRNALHLLTLTLLCSVAFFSLNALEAQAQEAATPAPAAAASPPATDALGVSSSVAGLPDSAVPAEVVILRGIEKELKEKYKKQVFMPSNVPSLVFTPSQHALLSEARMGFNTRVVTPAEESVEELGDPDATNYQGAMSVRVLSLGGIVFNTPDEWTIYLNNRRVTPATMPKQAIDLRVYKDFVELRWFDAQTNQVFPVRLRPNQSFNLDARIFLPG